MSRGPLDKSVFVYDDSPAGSVGKGTRNAISAVRPGQLIRWKTTPLDLQTSVWIGGITFGTQGTAESAMPSPPPVPAPIEDTSGAEASEGLEALASVEAAVAMQPPPPAPWLLSWEGYAPVGMFPDVLYPYTIHLKFGNATHKTIAIEGPKLSFPSIGAPAPIGADGVL